MKPWNVCRFTAALCVALLLSCGDTNLGMPDIGRSESATTTCTPYAPPEGLFNNTLNLVNVPTSWTTVGSYQIQMTSSLYQVRRASDQVLVFQTDRGSGQDYPGYLFFGTNNRYLVLDRKTSSNPWRFRPVVVDLGAYAGSVLSGTSLSDQNVDYIDAAPQFRVFPATGNGLAFFSYFGTSHTATGTIEYPRIYRSDTGARICQAGAFTPAAYQQAEVEGRFFHILDGSTHKESPSCPLPEGILTVTPASRLDFGDTSPTGTIDRSFTLTNTGNDCLNVTGVTGTTHFQPVGFSSFSLPTNGSSNSVTVRFAPNGATGTIDEDLSVSRTPDYQGNGTLAARGESCSGYGDTSNCGTCGHVCSVPSNGAATCVSGTCGISCNAGYTPCGSSCVNTTSDPLNCGACGNSCGQNATCSSSACQCNSGYGICNGQCWSETWLSGYNACTNDCGCGVGPDRFCAAGPFDCELTALASYTFSLPQQFITWTGTSESSGNGSFVAVNGASTTFYLQTIRNLQLHFDFYWEEYSGPWTMKLDLAFKIDGTEYARARFSQQGAQSFDAVAYNVPSGANHTLSVVARTVLVSGPPTNNVWIAGDGYWGGNSNLSATVIRDFY